MSQLERHRPAFLVTFPVHYFASVMATGILADACAAWGLDLPAYGLFGIGVLFYVACAVLLLLRLHFAWESLCNDFLHAGTGASFLTLVVATNVLGSGFLTLERVMNLRIFRCKPFVLSPLRSQRLSERIFVRACTRTACCAVHNTL